MEAVGALDADAGLVAGHHLGTVQRRKGRVATTGELRFGPAQHVGQAALADREAEQVLHGPFQPLVGQRLEGLQVQHQRVQARAEGCRTRSRRPLHHGLRAAAGAVHRQASMLLDARLHRRDVDFLVHADDRGRQIRRQRQAAVGATGRTVIDDGIGIGRKHALVPFVARLRPARAGLFAPLLAIRRGRLGRGARRFRRPLKLQHQFDQFRLAQPFEILATHAAKESASSPRHKPKASPPSRQPSPPHAETPWVITKRKPAGGTFIPEAPGPAGVDPTRSFGRWVSMP